MKKITSFLTMVLMLMMAVPSMAQVDELKNMRFNIGDPVQGLQEFQTNTWYLLAGYRGDEEPFVLGYLYDGGIYEDETQTTFKRVQRSSTTDVLPTEDISADVYGNYLVRFLPSDEHADGYVVQFGTGNYVQDNESQPRISDNIYDACNWTVNLVDSTGENQELFFFNVWTEDYDESLNINGFTNLGSRIDCEDTQVCYWEAGNVSKQWNNGYSVIPEKGNYRFFIYNVELTQGSEIDTWMAKVSTRFQELIEYYGTFETGTEPGQYGEAEVEAFYAALDAVAELLDDPEWTPTVEALEKLYNDMNETYEAVLASQVAYRPADGYYRLYTQIQYANQGPDVIDPETGDTIPGGTIYPIKAMYAKKTMAAWKTLDETDCTFLWRFDYDTDGRYQVYNAAYDTRFKSTARSTKCEMAEGLDPVEYELDVLLYGRDEESGMPIVALRQAGSTDDYAYLHQETHNNGSGTAGDCVGWNFQDDPSHWIMMPVDDAEAAALIEAFAPIKDHDKMVTMYDSILAAAKADLLIAEDHIGKRLITDASQYSSAMTEPNEGAIANLIDGDASSFWHSKWSSGSVDAGTHYLQADMGEPISTGLVMEYMRRNTANDHPSDFSLYGYTEEPDLEATAKEDGTLLGHYYFNDYTVSVLFTSDEILFDGEYQYFRIYGEVCGANVSYGNRGYWHAAEINFRPVQDNPNAQYKFMGELYDNLKQVIEDQADIESEDLTIDDYNALKAAYDAFLTKFVDPTPLRDAIAAATPKLNLVREGTDPGYWPAESSAAMLKQTLEEAENYDADGDYTPEKSENYVTILTSGLDNLFAEAIGVSTDKWYQIRFLTEEQFEENGWDTADAGEVYDSDDDLATEGLFGRAAAPGYLVLNETTGYSFVEAMDKDDVVLGQGVYFDEDDDFEDPEISWWRFVEVGDSAYMIQHKTSGLFLRAAGTSGQTTLDAQPTLFNVSAMGGGANLVKATSISGDANSYLHGQQSKTLLVTWDNTTPGSNSSIAIHEVGDVTEAPATTFNKEVVQGQLYTICYPVEIGVTEGAKLYTFKGIAGTPEEVTDIILTPAEVVAAGQPAFLIVDGEYVALEEGEEAPLLALTHGMEPVAAPATENAFTGLFFSKSIAKGKIVANEKGGVTVTKKSANKQANNTAYVDSGAPIVEAAAGDVVLAIDGKYTSIEDVINSVATNGAIYSVDGKLLGNGNINTVRTMGRGLYIVNGVKVMVK